MNKGYFKASLLIVLTALTFLLWPRDKSGYTLKQVEHETGSIQTKNQLETRFGQPRFISKTENRSHIEYTYRVNDDDEIIDGFVGFDVKLSTHGSIISWNPIFMEELREFMKDKQ